MKNEKGRYAIMKKTSMLPVLLGLLSCKEEPDGTKVVQGLKIQSQDPMRRQERWVRREGRTSLTNALCSQWALGNAYQKRLS